MRVNLPFRAERIAQSLAMMICLWLLSGCGHLYSANPRYGRKSGRRVRPSPTQVRDRRQGKLKWPVAGRVVRGYGVKVDPTYGTKTKNLGIDIACARDTRVKAVASGRVSYADRFMGYGKMVIVEHGEGLHSIYSRLRDIAVSVGAQVREGDALAFAGDTLHLEIRKQGKSVDPEKWLVNR